MCCSVCQESAQPFASTILAGFLCPSCNLNVCCHRESADEELSVLQLPHLHITSSLELLRKPLFYLLECGGAPSDIPNETSPEDVPNCVFLTLLLLVDFLSPGNLRPGQFRGMVPQNVLLPCASGTGPLSVSYPFAYVAYQKVVAILGVMPLCRTSVTPFIHSISAH